MKVFDTKNNYNSEILGSFIGTEPFLNNKKTELFKEIRILWDKLRFVSDLHTRFCYLKFCASHSKIYHFLKTIPVF